MHASFYCVEDGVGCKDADEAASSVCLVQISWSQAVRPLLSVWYVLADSLMKLLYDFASRSVHGKVSIFSVLS
jgi:hypothetical protein